MDPMVRWGIRLVEWFRNPPSRQHVILMGVVIAFCLALVLIERFIGWPEWATMRDQAPRIVRP